MAKGCGVDNCNWPRFGGGYCKYHQNIRKDKSPRKIRYYSEKRSKINRSEYAPKARQYIIDHPDCNIKSEVCTGASQCVNHIKGKATIALLLDSNHWEASCFACNNWIEANHAWANERGHKLPDYYTK